MRESRPPPRSLLATSQVTGGGRLLRLAGVLDEKFDGARVFEGALGVVVVDFEQVPSVTSAGLKAWLSVRHEADYLGFVHAHAAVVTQFNTVTGFDLGGQLLSLYLPYVCEGCGDSLEHHVDVRERRKELLSLRPPEVSCLACARPGTLDDNLASYLSYVVDNPLPSPPPLADAMLEGVVFGRSARLRVRKQLGEQVTTITLSGDLTKEASFKRLAEGLDARVVVLAGGLGETTEEGASRLGAFLATPGIAFHIAHAPLPLWKHLASPALSNVAVASVRAPCRCLACGRTSPMMLGVRALSLFSEGAPLPADCPVCGSRRPVTPSIAKADFKLVRRLLDAPLPVEKSESPAPVVQKAAPPNIAGRVPRAPRKRSNLPARLLTPGGVELATGRCKDISQSGLFLATEGGLPPVFTQVKLQIDLPNGGKLECACRVVRLVPRLTARNSGAYAGCGLQFLNVPGFAESAVEQLLRSLPV